MELVRILADAHALGALEREKARARRARQAAAPVLCLPKRAVVGFVADTADADLLDGVMARVLRECAGRGVKEAVLDVAGSRREDELLHRTIAGFAASPESKRVVLVVTGLASVARCRAQLEDLGADLSEVKLFDALDRYLSDLPGFPA